MPSLFVAPPPGDDLPLWEALFPDAINKLGSNLVVELSKEERDREKRGLRDPGRNPMLRSSFCPDAWTSDVVEETLLDSWICMHSGLQKLDRHYASPFLQTKQLKAAIRFAINMSEMPVGPGMDFLAGCSIGPLHYTPELESALEAAKKLHFGQESRISGLPKSKKRLKCDVFGAREHFDRTRNAFARSQYSRQLGCPPERRTACSTTPTPTKILILPSSPATCSHGLRPQPPSASTERCASRNSISTTPSMRGAPAPKMI
jgi:hypothetical protein